MTPSQIAEIEERLAAATPGPWLYKGKNSEFYTRGEPPYTYGDFITQLSEHGAEKISDANIEMIEHAATDIAALLAVNAALLAENAKLREVLSEILRIAGPFNEPARALINEKLPGVQP